MSESILVTLTLLWETLCNHLTLKLDTHVTLSSYVIGWWRLYHAYEFM